MTTFGYTRSREAGGGGAAAVTNLGRTNQTPEIWLPQNANALGLSSGNPGWSAWTNLGTPLAADFYLSHLLAKSSFAGTSGCLVAVEIGSGNGAVIYTEHRDLLYANLSAGATMSGFFRLDSNLQPAKIPAGTQVQARVYNGSIQTLFYLGLAGWSGAYPTWTALPHGSAAGPGLWNPDDTGTTGVTVTTGVFPAWGPVVQLIAAAATDLLVTQYTLIPAGLGLAQRLVAFQFGVGPAGAELWPSTTISGHGLPSAWIWPPVYVPAGSRLAVQGSSPGGASLDIGYKTVGF